ncbi:S49 family peptidase [Stappia sp. F7233]|uniref:S49 family peptidase n=1 Tax=Stappia albiluteola TaxID=2758565 RepID=A0A839AI43_9HYPH|nr:S49 family peptidase [Stappia albiluteola]MBA5779520.1 S49 family peptidase [Stappia albiluteola]
MIPLGRQAYVAIAQGSENGFVQTLTRAAEPDSKVRGVVWLDEVVSRDLYASVGGVAVVGVRGYLVDTLPFHGSDWITGYNGIRMAVSAALGDPDIKAIVLDIDSPGGMVAGCFELVGWLRDAGRKKPLMAIVKDMAASAAYAIASAAEAITVPMTGSVGSIGVVRMHVDISGLLEKGGWKITVIQSGARKTDGSPYRPLDPEAAEDWQATVDAFRSVFADHVAEGRGIGKDEVLGTEARLFEGPIGTKAAADLGLIDAVMAPDEAFARILEEIAATA